MEGKALFGARGRDRISQLPEELKDKILELLPFRDAVRISILSTQWRDVWFRHGFLEFDSDFFGRIEKYSEGEEINVINNILLQRTGPVREFTLCMLGEIEQPDIDRWCPLLSRNGIEELYLYGVCRYNLPACILSCPTIKIMKLEDFRFTYSNVPCIFPNLTSLSLKDVEFRPNAHRTVYTTIPNLEKLAFWNCSRLNNFEFNAPKLQSVFVGGYANLAEANGSEWRWSMLHLEEIRSLWISGFTLKYIPDAVLTPSKFPTAKNLQVIQLSAVIFNSSKHLIFLKLLLQKSPQLCEIDIMATEVKGMYDSSDSSDDEDITEDLKLFQETFFINGDLKMLHTLRFECFDISGPHRLFLELLLSKSPALEKVVIVHEKGICDSIANEISNDLLNLPRVSPNVEFFFHDGLSCSGELDHPNMFEGFISDT